MNLDDAPKVVRAYRSGDLHHERAQRATYSSETLENGSGYNRCERDEKNSRAASEWPRGTCRRGGAATPSASTPSASSRAAMPPRGRTAARQPARQPRTSPVRSPALGSGAEVLAAAYEEILDDDEAGGGSGDAAGIIKVHTLSRLSLIRRC